MSGLESVDDGDGGDGDGDEEEMGIRIRLGFLPSSLGVFGKRKRWRRLILGEMKRLV